MLVFLVLLSKRGLVIIERFVDLRQDLLCRRRRRRCRKEGTGRSQDRFVLFVLFLVPIDSRIRIRSNV